MSQETKLKSLLSTAKKRKEAHSQEISQAYSYTYPARETERQKGVPVDRTKMFDNTAVNSTINLTTTTQRLLFPQNSQWGFVEFKNPQDKKRAGKEVREGVEDANRQLHQLFDISNFYVAAGEAIKDCIISGTGCLAFSQDKGELHFMAIPIKELFFLENHKGEVDVVFRQHEMTARQVELRFPDKIPADIKKLATELPDTIQKVLEIVVPKDGRFEFTVVLEEEWIVLDEQTGPLNPFIVFRWDKTVGEVWGEGPVRLALPHIKSANKMGQLILRHGAYAAFGLWQVTDETINVENLAANLSPGMIVPIRTEMKAVPFPGSFAISQNMLSDERSQIRQLLFDEGLKPAGEQGTPPSAEEVRVRREKFLAQVGAPALRLDREFVSPVVEQALLRLQMSGKVNFVDNQEDLFKVTIISAASRSIKFSETMNDLNGYAALVQAFGQPIADQIVNRGRIAKETAEGFGISEKVLNSDEERAAVAKQQAEQAQAAQLLEAAKNPNLKLLKDDEQQ